MAMADSTSADMNNNEEETTVGTLDVSQEQQQQTQKFAEGARVCYFDGDRVLDATVVIPPNSSDDDDDNLYLVRHCTELRWVNGSILLRLEASTFQICPASPLDVTEEIPVGYVETFKFMCYKTWDCTKLVGAALSDGLKFLAEVAQTVNSILTAVMNVKKMIGWPWTKKVVVPKWELEEVGNVGSSDVARLLHENLSMRYEMLGLKASMRRSSSFPVLPLLTVALASGLAGYVAAEVARERELENLEEERKASKQKRCTCKG